MTCLFATCSSPSPIWPQNGWGNILLPTNQPTNQSNGNTTFIVPHKMDISGTQIVAPCLPCNDQGVNDDNALVPHFNHLEPEYYKFTIDYDRQ